jgi:hypothetical protein
MALFILISMLMLMLCVWCTLGWLDDPPQLSSTAQHKKRKRMAEIDLLEQHYGSIR